MIAELDRVVLTTDAPDHGLVAGDVGTVVHVYSGGEAFEVEFLTLSGRTIAVLTLKKAQVRTIRDREVAHARAVA